MDEFEEIYARNLKSVYRFLLRLSGSPDIAEELTQETFFLAFEHLDRFRGTCKISVWLCQIAKHSYYAWCRKNKALEPEESLEEYRSRDNVEAAVVAADERRRIHKILHGLAEPYKEVFTLRVMGELSYRDVGRLFKKSESWARVTYYRAKCMIQERLGGDGNDEL
ncbi:RNA polymerase sigma factor [Dorea sp. D27]|uniref:RNA polymerase sigma factor n=1 Tax=Dorea sp. D27 TaxID=658665 RepID=UPI0006739001|nr:sigma-70 family RNA polymerase sigma factor [Dorea sp. D27]KMZ55031.1 putative RNA polymerase ECF-type sigma factor [Dorea sp. D27]